MKSDQSNVKHILLPGADGFSVWPWAVVRGAGFPAAWILQLGAPGVARAAERMLDARRQVRELQSVVIERLLQALRERTDAGRSQLKRALRTIRKGAMPEPAGGDAALLWEDWKQALAALSAAQAQFVGAFEHERLHTRDGLRRLAGEPRLREAIAWQNPPAVRFMLDKLLAASPEEDDDARLRYAEINMAFYVQRYCVKNDTIGFFGPVCWTRVSGEGPGLTVTPGEQLVASSEIFYEDWAITELCKVLDKNPALRPWLRPRRLPVVGLVGNEAYLLMPTPMKLSDIEARVLAMCNGTRTARALAAEILQSPGHTLASDADVFAVIEGLCKRGLAVWKVETIMSMRPQELLRELLHGVDDEALRQQALAPLDELERARQAVAGAKGAEALLAAMDTLEKRFEEITGQPASRNAGRMYAARRLVFLDCRRADEITIGPAVLERISPVLAIVTHAARWFTSEVARSYRQALETIYEQLVAQMQTREIPFLRMWLAAQSLFPLDGSRLPPPMEAVTTRLREKWQEVLAVPAAAGPVVNYSSHELLPRAREVFRAQAPGWASARHHGPDIMLAAKDAAAIERQDFFIVLGEFHCAINTSIPSCFLSQHSHIEDMYDLWEADMPEPSILPGVPRQTFPVRVNRELATDKDYRLEWAPEIAGPPRARALSAGELVVVKEQDRVSVRSRDGGLRFDLIEFFGQVLSGIVPYFFQLPSGSGGASRLVIDDVVVGRQSWKLAPSEQQFWAAKTADARFLETRAWIQEQGIPRFCFVRTPVELKPIYIDFESPVYVEVFGRLCKNTVKANPAHRMTLSEMLPTLDQLWLTDRDQNHYTSEIRLVLVDRGDA